MFKQLFNGSMRNIKAAKAKAEENNRILDEMAGYLDSFFRSEVAGRGVYVFYEAYLVIFVCTILACAMSLGMMVASHFEIPVLADEVRLMLALFAFWAGLSLVGFGFFSSKLDERGLIFPDEAGFETLEQEKEILLKKKAEMLERKTDLREIVDELSGEAKLHGGKVYLEDENVCFPVVAVEYTRELDGERKRDGFANVVNFWAFRAEELREMLWLQMKKLEDEAEIGE